MEVQKGLGMLRGSGVGGVRDGCVEVKCLDMILQACV